jgi:hypothetical protein
LASIPLRSSSSSSSSSSTTTSSSSTAEQPLHSRDQTTDQP